MDIDGVAPIDQISPAYGAALENRASTAVSVFGRLRPGVSLSAAREAVRIKARQLERAYPATNKNVGAVLVREQCARPSITVCGIAPGIAAMFMTLVMLVMLVACANIASLLLARVVARGRDLAVRAAIGASQWRLVRQVLVECALLALLGGLGAVAVTYGAVRAVESINIATDIPVRWGVELNGRIIAFTMIATLHRRARCRSRSGIRSAETQPPRRAQIRHGQFRDGRVTGGCARRSWLVRSRSRWWCSSAPDCSCGARRMRLA